MDQAQEGAEQAFALIVKDDGTLEVEPGPAFGAGHIADMVDAVSTVEEIVANDEERRAAS